MNRLKTGITFEIRNNHKWESTTEKCPWKLLFLNYEHINNESLQLKQDPRKVTIKGFSFSQFAIPHPAALLKNKLFHFSKKFDNFKDAIFRNTFEWLFLRAITKSYNNNLWLLSKNRERLVTELLKGTLIKIWKFYYKFRVI